MDEQINFEDLDIGTKESVKLKPAHVKIVKITIAPFGKKGANKVTCSVQHPESLQPINISSVRLERKQKLETTGLWINMDDEKKLQKGSALVHFLNFLGCKTIRELEGKWCHTIEDDSGYLVFKAY